MVYTISDGDEIVYTYSHEVFFTQGSSHMTIPKDKVELWWPSGFGKAKLYDFKIEALRNGNAIATYTQKLGIRTIELKKTDFVDNDGNGEFVFVVNGENVFIRGTNWKPLHQLDGYMAGLIRCGKNLVQKFFGKAFEFKDWKHHALAINLLSAELFKDIIEYCRICRWSKSGVIWWSLMDMWPMICNYSVIDCDFNKKLAYHWIKQSQQTFVICAATKEVGGDLFLYAANDTLCEKRAEYTVTAYDKNLNKKQIAQGVWVQTKNSSTEIQKLAPSADAELWIIEWKIDGKVYKNHAFSKKYADYDTMRKWIEIIGKECGFADEITEL